MVLAKGICVLAVGESEVRHGVPTSVTKAAIVGKILQYVPAVREVHVTRNGKTTTEKQDFVDVQEYHGNVEVQVVEGFITFRCFDHSHPIAFGWEAEGELE